jgi:acetyl esterase/lipase
MTTIARAIGLAALVLAAWVSSGRGADAPKKVATSYDIVFTKAGATELRLDLARPAEGEGPFPAVVIIHGGAWRSGTKDDLRGTLADFARQGYVAIAPQYRLCPQETFPAQVHDVKAAVRWLKANAKPYQVDPDHIGAVGFSAGGHLALMLGVTGPADGLEGESPAAAPSTKIQAVVNYFGPTDLAAEDIPQVSRSLVRDFLGGTPQEKPAAAAKASPLTFVSEGDAPVLTFQGTKDPLVPYTQATKLTDALTRAGVPGRVELLLGAGHGWQGAERSRTRIEAFEFLDTYLKPKPAQP